jgi:hypothetical protein
MSEEFELLTTAPLTLGRPLALLNGRAYAAAWPFVQPPGTAGTERPAARQTLWVVRDDGMAFGEGAGQPLGALGLTVRLADRPPNDRLWSTAGLKAFREGRRPEPAEVFERMRAVVDRFIDFDHSLAPQRTMTEFVAAYALSTWLLEGFGQVGERARLSGRALQPWRAVLGVALWLEQFGVEGLYARLEQLAAAYQAERPELEADDLSSMVVKALMVLYQQTAKRSLGLEPLEACRVPMREILPLVEVQASKADGARKAVGPQRVGMVLGKLRLRRSRVAGKYERLWEVTREDVLKWAKSYATAKGEGKAMDEEGQTIDDGR